MGWWGHCIADEGLGCLVFLSLDSYSMDYGHGVGVRGLWRSQAVSLFAVKANKGT